MNTENKFFCLELRSLSGNTFSDGWIYLLSSPLELSKVGVVEPYTEKSWPCRSGVKSAQSAERCWESNHGHIPNSDLIVGTYQVNLDHYFSRLSQSQAFRIYPDPIRPKNPDPLIPDQKRSELMIHQDLGKGIGSNGCPVIYDYPDRIDDDKAVNFKDFLYTMDTFIRPVVGNLIDLRVKIGRVANA